MTNRERDYQAAPVCTCHNDFSTTHEACCGHDDGRDPDCPYHGDGSGPNAVREDIR